MTLNYCSRQCVKLLPADGWRVELLIPVFLDFIFNPTTPDRPGTWGRPQRARDEWQSGEGRREREKVRYVGARL